MAHSVIIWRISSTFTGTAPGSGGPYTFAAGNYVHAVLDDTTNTLTAKYSSTSSDNTGFEITGGPSLFSDPTGAAELITVAPFYQYCEGTTLHQVGTSNGWPYATLSNNVNNSECTLGNVCDLEISSDYTVTPTSDTDTSDGAIVGSATSSNGLIKFSMDPNFPYGSSAPGGTLPDISTWTNYSSSSDPITWTAGATPVCTVTPPTDPGVVKSDILQSTYSTSWITGQKYTFQYSFTVVSALSNWRIIYLVAYDSLMNELVSKPVALYGSPSGNSISGQWEMTAPAGVNYIGIYEQFFAGVNGSDTLTVNSFAEVTAADAPGVKTELNFTGLAAGTYTIYAKDAAGCQDSLSFVVPLTVVLDTVRYRMEFKDFLKISAKYHRVDIYERGYAGETEYVCGGETPVLIRYEGDANDPSKPLVPSNMEIQLMCEENEQFADLFLADDRKYLVKYYVDDSPIFSSPQLYWTGYVVPEFYSEPYLHPPFEVTVTVSDQIGEFKNLAFQDEAENTFRGEMSIIKILAAVFKKTNLELPFRCGVNVWADLMNQDDDPLLQAFLDMRIFEEMKCSDVLEKIALSFRGQIFQSMGYWWFIRLSDTTGTFNYREYDKDGNQTGSGVFAGIKELGGPSLNQSMFTERRQIRSFMRNYGKFAITHDLVKDGNIIDEGRFEEDDIEVQGSGNIGFKRWSLWTPQPGVTYGLEKVENNDSKGALFVDLSQVPFNTEESDNVVYSDVLPLENFGGKIRFKFQYMVSPKFKAPYIRLAWALKIHSASSGYWWFGQSGAGAWTVFNTDTRNEIYVTNFDSWQSFDLLLSWPTFAVWDSIQIFFYFHHHGNRDFVDITALKAYPSPKPGMMVMVSNLPEPESFVYKSEYSYDAESSPEVVRPDDYNVGDADHRVLWKRDSIFGPLDPRTGLVDRFKFDNVSIAIYPAEPTNAQIIDVPQELVYRQTVDTSVKSSFDLDVLIGDMLRIDPDNYRNERYLYRSYIRLSDGTPTQYWHRLGVSEQERLLDITLDDYIAQFKKPQFKLSGAIISSQTINFINSFRDNSSGGLERYRPITFEYDAKNAQYTIDMSAVNGGPDGEPPLVQGAFSHDYDDAYDGGIDSGEVLTGSFSGGFDDAYEGGTDSGEMLVGGFDSGFDMGLA